jgi:hypothetical protein
VKRSQSATHHRPGARGRAHWWRVLVTAASIAVLLPVGVAFAFWSIGSDAGGNGASAATTVDRGNTPRATVSGADVTVSWAPTSLASGAAVTGYLVQRYDEDTVTSQVLLTSCAGRQTGTSCAEQGVPPGRWHYSVTPLMGTSWTGAESSLSAVVGVDATAPVSAITLSDVTGNAFKANETVYYRGVAAGSFTLTNALTDAGSGPASSRTSELTGASTGWTHSPSTVSTPTGGPYVSVGFTWAAGTTGTVGESVHGRDVVGNEATSTLSFIDDSAAPVGATVSYPEGYQPARSVVITLGDGSDPASGVAVRQLQRASSALIAGTCGAPSDFTDVGPTNPTSPYTDEDATDGTCYRYRYVVTDRVGNQTIAVSPNVAKVDAAYGGPVLRTTASYSVLAVTGVTSTLVTSVSGDLGLSASGAIAGFPPGIVGGDIDDKNLDAAQAQVDLELAYADAAARTPTSSFAGDQINSTFHPGVHRTAGAFANTGTMTLDGDGDPNALFIFQIDAAMGPAADSRVVLTDGARASNVFWQVNGAVTVGARSTLSGTLMAHGAITLGDGVVLIGRALSGGPAGAVTMAANTIRFTTAPPPTLTIDGDTPNGAIDVTNDSTPEFTGTTGATLGRPVTVSVNGQALNATVASNGTWSATAAALSPGTYQVVASVRDADGNGSHATQTLTVEANPAPVSLGSAATYSVLSGTSIVNSGTTSHLGGNAGVSPAGTIGGLAAADVDGSIEVNTGASAQALADFEATYVELDGRTPHQEITGVLGAKTFRAGIYHSVAALDLTGPVTLDGQNLPNQVFIFQGDAAMTTAAGAEIRLINGALAANVYFQVTGAVSTGADSTLRGTFVARGAVTIGARGQLSGRILARGTITMADTTATRP